MTLNLYLYISKLESGGYLASLIPTGKEAKVTHSSKDSYRTYYLLEVNIKHQYLITFVFPLNKKHLMNELSAYSTSFVEQKAVQNSEWVEK